MRKKLLAMMLIAAVFVSGMAFGSSNFTTIKVQLNSLKVFVNGKQVTAPNIVYNGTTYVPLRAVSEGLGQAVQFDGSAKTVHIGETGEPEGNSQVLDPKQSQLKTPVTIEDLAYKLTIQPPNSIGTIYVDATYTNNSKYTLGAFQIIYLDKSKNEKRYLFNHDTVLPGETSPKFDTFGPSSGRESDIEVLEIKYTLVDKEGKRTWVDYDAKLKIYKVLHEK